MIYKVGFTLQNRLVGISRGLNPSNLWIIIINIFLFLLSIKKSLTRDIISFVLIWE